MAGDRIRLVVGLGNPGRDYEDHRHNAGFWFVERLAHLHGAVFRQEPRLLGQLASIVLAGYECRLLKPSTYMNRSGQAVASVAHYFKILPEQILVAHDELDLPAGVVRLKYEGGHAGHNGLRDVINALGSRSFYRLRIGIDRPHERGRVVDYVLSRPSKVEREGMLDALEDASGVVEDILAGEFQNAMTRLHSASRQKRCESIK